MDHTFSSPLHITSPPPPPPPSSSHPPPPPPPPPLTLLPAPPCLSGLLPQAPQSLSQASSLQSLQTEGGLTGPESWMDTT